MDGPPSVAVIPPPPSVPPPSVDEPPASVPVIVPASKPAIAPSAAALPSPSTDPSPVTQRPSTHAPDAQSELEVHESEAAPRPALQPATRSPTAAAPIQPSPIRIVTRLPPTDCSIHAQLD